MLTLAPLNSVVLRRSKHPPPEPEKALGVSLRARDLVGHSSDRECCPDLNWRWDRKYDTPAADPGFANVGVINQLSGVYVRNGWVLTANHVARGRSTSAASSTSPSRDLACRFRPQTSSPSSWSSARRSRIS